VRAGSPTTGVSPRHPRAAARAPEPLWTFTAENFELTTDPVVFADGTIVTTTRNAVIAFHADGRQRWRYDAADGVQAYSRPLIDTRGEIVVSHGHRLLRLRADGVVVGDIAVAAPGEVLAPPVPLEDRTLLMLATATDAFGTRARMIALDLQDALRWQFDLGPHRVNAVVPLAAGAVAVRIGGRVFRFAPDGTRTLANDLFTHPRIPFALDAEGRVLHDLAAVAGWQAATPSRLPTASLPRAEVCNERMLERAAEGTTLVPCLHGVYALDARGRKLWQTELPFVAAMPFARDRDGSLYIAGHGLHALAADGRPRWHATLTLPSPVAGVPPRAATPSTAAKLGPHHTIYLGSADNRVFALRADGSVEWIYLIGGESSAARTVTHLSWLNDALLVNAAGLIVLPVAGARLEHVTGERSERLEF